MFSLVAIRWCCIWKKDIFLRNTTSTLKLSDFWLYLQWCCPEPLKDVYIFAITCELLFCFMWIRAICDAWNLSDRPYCRELYVFNRLFCESAFFCLFVWLQFSERVKSSPNCRALQSIGKHRRHLATIATSLVHVCKPFKQVPTFRC